MVTLKTKDLVRVSLLMMAVFSLSHRTIGAPTVEISSPAENSEFPSDGSFSVEITGRASADTDHVALTLITADGTFPGIPVSGTTSWSQTVEAITPGINIIEAIAVDGLGHQSAVARKSFNYVVTSPISLSSTGSGAIQAAFNESKPLVVGNIYSLKATPQPKNIFQSWTLTTPSDDDDGPDVETTSELSFTMEDGLSILANFIPNPYPAIAAAYNEVLRDGSGNLAGIINFSIS